MNHDSAAAATLLRTGVLVLGRVVEETVTPSPDEGEFAVRLDGLSTPTICMAVG
jgi:hypothetical protein